MLKKLYQNGFGCCIQENVITEEKSANASSLDIKTAKRIIADNKEIRDILNEFDKTQQYPDFVGGSGLRHMGLLAE